MNSINLNDYVTSQVAIQHARQCQGYLNDQLNTTCFYFVIFIFVHCVGFEGGQRDANPVC